MRKLSSTGRRRVSMPLSTRERRARSVGRSAQRQAIVDGGHETAMKWLDLRGRQIFGADLGVEGRLVARPPGQLRAPVDGAPRLAAARVGGIEDHRGGV